MANSTARRKRAIASAIWVCAKRQGNVIDKIFAWWSGATLGALFDIRRRGQFVAKDAFGNQYYEERKPSRDNRKRRYVIYKGYAEASKIPPEWHGWLHYVLDAPPSDGDYRPRVWEKPHQPNLTGTPYAYRPPGSLAETGQRAAATGDYEAWVPEQAPDRAP